MIPLGTPARMEYSGNDLAFVFPTNFPVYEAANLIVYVTEVATEIETPLLVDVDYLLTGVNIQNTNGVVTLVDIGQPWLTSGKLAIGYNIMVKFTEQAYQPAKLRDLGRFAPENVERSIDRHTMNIIAIKDVADDAAVIAQEALDLANSLSASLDSSGLPDGALAGSFLESLDGETAGWKDGAYSGFSLRFGSAFTSTGLDDTIRKILNFGYIPATISLSCSPAQSVREKGTTVSSVTMTATTVKKSDNITSVTHFRNGVLVNTVSSPNPAGGSDAFTESTSFSDNMSFYAKVFDGTTLVQSNTVSYPFVYPYYYGAGVAGKTPAQVAALTKAVVSSNANYNVSFTSANGDVYYFAYPASYGNLTSILDENGFEVLSSFTKTVGSITGLDTTSVSYNIYAFNNPVIAGTTNFIFKR